MTIHTWTTIQIGHIITLRDGDHIFLKRANVIHCLDFDNLLSRSQGRNPHFSRNLPHDHAYIRQALKAKKIQAETDILGSEEELEVEVVEKVNACLEHHSRPCVMPVPCLYLESSKQNRQIPFPSHSLMHPINRQSPTPPLPRWNQLLLISQSLIPMVTLNLLPWHISVQGHLHLHLGLHHLHRRIPHIALVRMTVMMAPVVIGIPEIADRDSGDSETGIDR